MNAKPVIFVREGELSGQSWPIEGDAFLIGRGSDCNLILPERQVSRHHVRIRHEQGAYVLYDLGSKNGTHLNGSIISEPTVLRDGDEIQVALSVRLVYIGTDATIPLTFEPPTPAQRLELDEDQRTVIIDGNTLTPPLSLAQFRLLKALYDADGAVCTRDSIVETVWPGTEGIGVSEQAIDALVRRLRDRLAELDDFNYIVTVRGHGFRLENEKLN
ncbi:MAG: FHA domain-containing protein [Anaerolineae bacterium]|nr:FHA domain-containing protein [Anaerolineae bacterium]MCO5190107.1 FHA domain-containing protein [Anaerolineae bacterium]MCO5192693.1 FHA domain-containing protein [Anaerolineae bacterium]MCO5197795.1 FHA domain-containing protein [Anaerolineae bacterium]MCO5205291.1 FHA domain-containing protein [Anaerolineae bacterium]